MRRRGGGRRGPGSGPGAAPGASLSPAPSRPVHRPTGEGRRALWGGGRSGAALCELRFFFFWEGGQGKMTLIFGTVLIFHTGRISISMYVINKDEGP